MDERIKSEIDGGLESIQGMFESCKVRGEQFVDVAIASFEAGTIVEIYMTACRAIGHDGDEEIVNGFGMSISHVLGSLVTKVGNGMDKKLFDEAIEFGVKVHEQKVALQKRVEGIMKKDH